MSGTVFRRSLALLAAGALIAACGGSDGDEGSDATTTATTPVTDPVGTDVAPTIADIAPDTAYQATEAPDTSDGPSVSTDVDTTIDPDVAAGEGLEWNAVFVGEDCMCADGSDFELWSRQGDPERVVLYLEGGGACFSAETCSFTDGTYTSSLSIGDSPEGRGGLFDRSNPENPIAEHAMVYVPYCSGDTHLGDATTEYSPELTVEHNGYVNAMSGLDYLVETYPDVEQLVVMGASAGSVATPLFAALAADRLPNAEVITFGDSSGAYPDVPAVNETIGTLWGSVIPDWPENAGLTAAQWSIPGLYVQAGLHNPDIRFGRFDYAYDEVQSFFGALAGVGADQLVTLIDQTAAQAESTGVPLASYVAPGTDHTIVTQDAFYTMEVEGVRLADWFNELIDGDTPPADVRCVECNAT